MLIARGGSTKLRSRDSVAASPNGRCSNHILAYPYISLARDPVGAGWIYLVDKLAHRHFGNAAEAFTGPGLTLGAYLF
jgi:hypothetical protein